MGRAVGNWAALRRDAPPCSLVVSHGALGRCMVAAALGGTMDTFRNPRFQFDNRELVEVAWAPGAPAAACWRRLHRTRSPWEAAEDSASSEAAAPAASGAVGEAFYARPAIVADGGLRWRYSSGRTRLAAIVAASPK